MKYKSKTKAQLIKELTDVREELNVLRTTLWDSDNDYTFAQIKWQTIFNTIPDVLILTDMDYNVISCNNSVERVLGYTTEELIGMNYTTFVADEMMVGLRPTIGQKELLKKGYYYQEEFLFKRKNGEIFPAYISVGLINNEKGTPVGLVGTIHDITEHKQAEEDLIKGEERYRVTLDGMLEGCQIIGYDWRYLYINDVAAKHGQRKKEELLDQTMMEMYPGIDKTEMFGFLRRCMEKRLSHRMENEFTFPDGSVGWFELSIQPVPEGIFILSLDVTERKDVEAKLQRQTALSMANNRVLKETITCETEEELARTCLAVAEELTGSKFGYIGELNATGLMDTIAVSNPGWDECKVIVSDAKKFIMNMSIRGIDRSTLKEGKSRIVNKGEIETHPDRASTPEGHPKITAFLGVPLKQAGRTIGMIGLGNKEKGYNIHDQEAIENLSVAIVESLKRKRAEILFKKSEAKLNDVVGQSNDGIYVLAGNRFVFTNPRFTEITGYKLEEISGEEFQFTELLTEEGKKVIAKRDAIRKKGEEPPSRYEFKGLHKSGAEVDLETSVTSIIWDGVPATLGIVRDVSKRVQARKNLENALKKAEQANKVKDLFMANMSHEVRTPLNAILGFTEILKEKFIKTTNLEDKSIFTIIDQSGRRLLRTIHEVLDISQIKAGTFKVVPKPLSLSKVTEKVVKKLQPDARDKELKLLFEPKISDDTIVADEYSLEQALTNLVDNAIKYTQEGQVQISMKKEADRIDLEIKDTGIGMSKEYQKALFEPFSQESVGYSKNFQGIGLGLSLAKAHLDLNDIGLNIESSQGAGTTVILSCKAGGKMVTN